jgi:hypothetical protein
MTIIAFAGPSLPARDRETFGAVVWKPPAEAGDLLRLELDREDTVCLIDGYFDHRPAVRHKEILLLLAEGVRVLGAASIGALRAAEMDGFGMVGVGSIYRAYKRGAILGDDEVALIHGPSERDWRPLSLPLVDVRATLWRARRTGVIDRREARALLKAAVTTHYVERTWQAVVTASGLEWRDPPLISLMNRCALEQKRLDARECMGTATEGAPATREPPVFVRTPSFDSLARERGADIEARCAALLRPIASDSPSD